MAERVESLRKTWEKRSSDATEKVRSAIRIMLASEEEISFSSVAKKVELREVFSIKTRS